MKSFFYSIKFRVLFIVVIAIIVQYWLTTSFVVDIWNKQADSFSKNVENILLKEVKKGEGYFLRTVYRGIFLYKPQKDTEGMQEYLRNLRGMEGVESLRIFNNAALKKYRIAYDGDVSRLHRMATPIDCLACHPGVGDVGEKKVRMFDTWFYNDAKYTNNLAGNKSLLFMTHIYSEESCQTCHGSDKKVLGVMQANFSTRELEVMSKNAKDNFIKGQKNFTTIFIYAAIGAFIVSIFLIYLIVNGMFISKLKKIKGVIEKLSFGDTNVDVNVIPRSKDEIGSLKDSMELMIRAINFLK